MKKIIVFIMCLFILIGGANALEVDYNSEHVILYNYSNGEVIYEKAADEIVSVASMTKIMTALVILETTNDLDTKVVLQEKHFEGLRESSASVAGFRVGQTVTYRDLLYGILLPSGADAVQTLAIEIFGSNKSLVEKMNEKAKSLGLEKTHFINPTGLDAEGHYSTVREVSMMLKEALKNETFKKIFTTRKYLVSDKSITLYSTIVEPLNTIGKTANYIMGSKTGYTDDAGRCLASLAYDEENDIYYLMVTAKAKKRVEPVKDAVNTYEYLIENYSNHIIIEKDEILKQVKTKFAKEKKINVKSSDSVDIFLKNSDYDENKIVLNYNMSDKITKTLKSDTKIGTLEVLYDGKLLKTVELLTVENMHFSIWRLFLNVILPFGLLGCVCVFIFKKRK